MDQNTFYIAIIAGAIIAATILIQWMVIKGLHKEVKSLNNELDYMTSREGRHEIARDTIINGWQ